MYLVDTLEIHVKGRIFTIEATPTKMFDANENEYIAYCPRVYEHLGEEMFMTHSQNIGAFATSEDAINGGFDYVRALTKNVKVENGPS